MVNEFPTLCTHIAKITSVAYQRVNLIFRTVSHDITTLLRAYITYVRPLLEYINSVWSPLKQDIISVEKVRKFTKRLPVYRSRYY